MSILTTAMRSQFVDSLRQRYARELPFKRIANIDDIMFGAVKLFSSGTPFRPLFSKEAQEFLREDESHYLEHTLEPVVDLIWGYFISRAPHSQADFDAFHIQACELFLSTFEEYSYSYGNAQKFVNMLFKYLVCYEDSVAYKDHFKYCHMALDRYTYCGYRLPFYRDVVYPALHGREAGELTSWSKLTKEEYIAVAEDIAAYVSATPITYNEYLSICSAFPVFTSVSVLPAPIDYNLTPFEAEFFLWMFAKKCYSKTGGTFTYSSAFVRDIRSRL